MYALLSQGDLKLLESRAALPSLHLLPAASRCSPRTEMPVSLNMGQVLSHGLCHPSSPESVFTDRQIHIHIHT